MVITSIDIDGLDIHRALNVPARVLRVLGINKCPSCNFEINTDFQFHPETEEYITCSERKGIIDITGPWMVKAFDMVNILNEAESVNANLIKSSLKTLISCVPNNQAVPLLDLEIKATKNDHLINSWLDLLDEITSKGDHHAQEENINYLFKRFYGGNE